MDTKISDTDLKRGKLKRLQDAVQLPPNAFAFALRNPGNHNSPLRRWAGIVLDVDTKDGKLLDEMLDKCGISQLTSVERGESELLATCKQLNSQRIKIHLGQTTRSSAAIKFGQSLNLLRSLVDDDRGHQTETSDKAFFLLLNSAPAEEVAMEWGRSAEEAEAAGDLCRWVLGSQLGFLNVGSSRVMLAQEPGMTKRGRDDTLQLKMRHNLFCTFFTTKALLDGHITIAFNCVRAVAHGDREAFVRRERDAVCVQTGFEAAVKEFNTDMATAARAIRLAPYIFCNRDMSKPSLGFKLVKFIILYIQDSFGRGFGSLKIVWEDICELIDPLHCMELGPLRLSVKEKAVLESMTSKHVDPRTADELLPMVPMSIILKFSEAHKKKKGPKDKSASKDKKERDSEDDDDSDSDSDSDGSHFVESADEEGEETGVLPDHDDWSWLQ